MLTKSSDHFDSDASDARERLLAAAYELFSTKGTKAVGVDEIVEAAGVAKMTFYRHFPSKQDLVLAFLERREARWTYAWLGEEIKRRTSDPKGRLLVIFDVFYEWFQRDDFEGCAFINVLLEVPDRADQVHQATARRLANIRDLLKELAVAAGVRNPDDFVRKWHILMKGSIVAAGEGDHQAARRAQDLGRLLLSTDGPG